MILCGLCWTTRLACDFCFKCNLTTQRRRAPPRPLPAALFPNRFHRCFNSVHFGGWGVSQVFFSNRSSEIKTHSDSWWYFTHWTIDTHIMWGFLFRICRFLLLNQIIKSLLLYFPSQSSLKWFHVKVCVKLCGSIWQLPVRTKWLTRVCLWGREAVSAL